MDSKLHHPSRVVIEFSKAYMYIHSCDKNQCKKKLQTEESDQLRKKWRNIATSIRRKAIKQYWKERSGELRTIPRTFLKTLTPFLRDKGCCDAAIHLKEGNNIVQDRHEVTELFASYFATIADSTGIGLNTTPDADHPSVKRIENMWSDHVFSFHQVHRSEVLRALEKLNPHKATGHDLVLPKVLRMVADEVASPLTHLYNEIISRGTWPEPWKWGAWTPVFKKDDALNKGNYRPVTVLVTVDKVFEQLLAGQLEPLSNIVFDGFNSAYRKRYSCETALVRLVKDWKRSLDNSHKVGVLSTDMSKAFDCLSLDQLLSKLQACGLCSNSLVLLKSYFTNRKNRVRLGVTCGEWKAVNRRCPQGSSLGPVLSNFYQNDSFMKTFDFNWVLTLTTT